MVLITTEKAMTSPNLSSLFQGVVSQGDLSTAAVAGLNIPDIGAQIQEGLGVKVDDIPASEVVLVSLLIDDSGSIRFVKGNTEAVREGHNTVMNSLRDTKQAPGILAHTRYLNGRVLFPYSLIKDAVLMDTGNFDPMGGTPLYDQMAVMLATVVAKMQEFADNGVPARAVTTVVTDGHDEGSLNQRASDIKVVVEDLLRTEKHIIAAMGIADGSTHFRDVFKEMGIRDEWILTPGNTPGEIRKAFQMVSRSAVRASQNAGSFSKTAGGGFATP